MSPRDALLNPDIFPKPTNFDPDRWLRPMSDEQKQQMQANWLPFNKGPRMCLGMKYASKSHNEKYRSSFSSNCLEPNLLSISICSSGSLLR